MNDDLGKKSHNKIRAKEILQLNIEPKSVVQNNYYTNKESPELSLNIEFDFPALIKTKTENFTGRQWLFDKINNWFNSPSKDHLLLLGVPGFGKTSIAAKVIKEWFPDQIAGYHFCEADDPLTLEPAIFLRSIARMLTANIPEFKQVFSKKFEKLINSELCKTNPKDVFQVALLDPLTKISSQSRRFIVIDALEESIFSNTDITIAELIAAKQKVFPPWLHLLVTARDEFNIKRDLTFGFTIEELDVESLENKADVTQFVSRQVDEYKKEFASRNWLLEDIIQVIAEKSNGNFLYAYYALRELASSKIKHLQDLPVGLDGLYSRFFSRQFPASEPEKFDKLRSLLEILVVAHKPLSTNFLSFILSEEIPDVSRSLRLILQYLDKRSERYSLFHKSFNDWLISESQNGGHYAVNIEYGNAKIGNACIASLQKNDQFVDYAVNSVIPHLIAGMCEDELYQVLYSEVFACSNFTIKHIQDLFIGLGGHERSVSERSALERLQMLERVLTRLEEKFIEIDKDSLRKEVSIQPQIIDELILAIIKVNSMIADRSSPLQALDFLKKARKKNQKFIRYVSLDRYRTYIEMAASIFFKFSERYIFINQVEKARRIIRWSLFLRRKLIQASPNITERLKHRDAVIWCLISLGNYAGRGNNNRERAEYIEMAYEEYKVLEKEAKEIGVKFDRSTAIMFSNLAFAREDKRKEHLNTAIDAYKKVYNYSLDDRHLDYTLASAMGYLCETYLSEGNASEAQNLLSEAESHLASCLAYKPSGEASYERLKLRLNWSKALIKFYEGHKELALNTMSEIINALIGLNEYFKHPVVEKDINRYSREKARLESCC